MKSVKSVKSVKSNNYIVIGFVLFVVVLIGIGMYMYAVNSKYRISSEKAKQLIREQYFDVILDVRTNVERETLGFYPNSLHIQSADLEVELPKKYPDKNTKILAYCNTGHRARLAVDKLHKMGYTNSLYISSGYKSILS